MASAGSCRKASVEFKPTNPDGFPFIKIRTFPLPLSATFPSISTDTDGTLSKTSLTLPPLTVKSLPTLYIFLSNLISTVVFSAIISTASNACKSEFIFSVPRLVSWLKLTFNFVIFSNEKYSTETSYVPWGMEILKLPSGSVIPPPFILFSTLLKKVMVAYSSGRFVSISIIFPETRTKFTFFCPII